MGERTEHNRVDKLIQGLDEKSVRIFVEVPKVVPKAWVIKIDIPLTVNQSDDKVEKVIILNSVKAQAQESSYCIDPFVRPPLCLLMISIPFLMERLASSKKLSSRSSNNPKPMKISNVKFFIISRPIVMKTISDESSPNIFVVYFMNIEFKSLLQRWNHLLYLKGSQYCNLFKRSLSDFYNGNPSYSYRYQ